MISEQGAILIATVYPIGLLLLLIEGVGAFGAFVELFGRKLRWLALALIVLVTSSIVTSIALCISAVSSGTRLDGFYAVVVGTSGAILGVFFSFAVGLLLVRGIPALTSNSDAD